MASVPRRGPGMAFSNFSAILCLFWLFSSTALAASGVIGIDFGTEYIKAALVKPGIPLEIVLTKDSRRKELSAVTFKPIRNAPAGSFPERLYGSDAAALSARFPGDVYPNLKAILGLPLDDPRVLEYSTRYPSLVIGAEKTRGTAEFRSGAFTPEEDAWMVEELLAMELKSIQTNAEAHAGKGSLIRDVVITIPPYFDAEEKRAIGLAVDLAGLRLVSLVSDGLAVGLNYATSRTFPSVTDGAKPELHLVFDMGAGSTKATILKFQGRTIKEGKKSNKTIQEIDVLGTGWDRTLGGDALNSLIVDDMIAKFVDSKGAKAASVEAEAVHGQGRASAMLWKQAERLRQVLSANSESQANFEGLYNDIDFRYKLTRVDFEKLASAHADRLYPAVKMALDRAGLGISDMDSIILHGGATRTPFVQRELERLVGQPDKLRSNVNADEAAVFGAAFKGAGYSPSFRVKNIKTHDSAGYAVGMKWTNVNLKPQKQRLFTPQSHLGVVKVVPFQNQEDFDVHFYQHVDTAGDGTFSGEREVVRLVTQNLTATVTELKEKRGCTGGDIVTKFGVRLNSANGEVEITEAAVHCEVDEDDKKGGVVDGVKGLFGFGSKKSDQDIFQDEEIVEPSKDSSSTSTSSATKSSSSQSASASASASATEDKPKGKRLIAIPLDFKVERKGYPALPADVLSKKKERLAAFDESDHSRRLQDEALNQLEGFTYRIRDMLDDSAFTEASTEVERKSLSDLSEIVSEWLSVEGHDASRTTLVEKLKELKALVTPIESRKDEASNRPGQVKLLQDALDSAQSVIDMVKEKLRKEKEDLSSASLSPSSSTSTTSATASTETDDFFEEDSTTSSSTESSETPKPTPAAPMFTKEDLDLAITQHQEVSDWLAKKLAEQEKLKPTENPVLLIKEIALKANEITKANMAMLMKGMKAPEMPKKPSSSKTSKNKKSKTVKAKKSKKTASAESSATTSADAANGTGDAEFYEPPTDEEIREGMERLEKEKGPEKPHKKDEL